MARIRRVDGGRGHRGRSAHRAALRVRVPLPLGSSAKVDSGLAAAVDDGSEATFFVVLKDQADLSAAEGKRGHAVKAKAAFKALRAHAADSQKSLTSFLDKEKVGHQDFWIANAVEVRGDADLVAKIAKRSDVARVVEEQHYELDDVEPSGREAEETGEPDAATTEWGVSDIRADKVWSQYKDRGEGIVIANIDSGVQYDHPDLVANYRGNNGDGTFSHDYNWYDPTAQCGTEGVPCDNNGHGTHTMGTMAERERYRGRPGRHMDSGQGLRDEVLLGRRPARLRPVDPRADRPRRAEPASGTRPEHRQQLLGRRKHHLLPGHHRVVELGQASSRRSPRATPVTARPVPPPRLPARRRPPTVSAPTAPTAGSPGSPASVRHSSTAP